MELAEKYEDLLIEIHESPNERYENDVTDHNPDQEILVNDMYKIIRRKLKVSK